MPLRLRAQRRAFSRDASRAFATIHPHRPRHGEIAAIVHGPHDTAWLLSGTINGGGQARINHKRNQRAEFWRTVRIRVSAEVEPYFRKTLHLLGKGTRIDRAHRQQPWFGIDLDVHIPGAPADAVEATPVYRSVRVNDDHYVPVLDHVEWRRADGSRIDTRQEVAA
jgi:hypothetical protein